MSRYEEACPVETRTRANSCQSCCAERNGVPPCVAAFLGGRTAAETSNVISLRSVDLGQRKAA